VGATRRDPFITLRAEEPPPPLAPPMPEPAPAIEQASPVQIVYGYLGSFTAPDGEVMILLRRNETIVETKIGTALEGGYVVQKIEQGIEPRDLESADASPSKQPRMPVAAATYSSP
jgi:hypothetical protein